MCRCHTAEENAAKALRTHTKTTAWLTIQALKLHLLPSSLSRLKSTTCWTQTHCLPSKKCQTHISMEAPACQLALPNTTKMLNRSWLGLKVLQNFYKGCNQSFSIMFRFIMFKVALWIKRVISVFMLKASSYNGTISSVRDVLAPYSATLARKLNNDCKVKKQLSAVNWGHFHPH